jgi:ribonuclease P protein component
MLPRQSRLPRAAFAELLTSRSFFNTPNFTLRIGKAEGDSPRVAVSVSKKVSKSAVVRNTIRRRVYSALPPLGSVKPGSYLLMAKSGAAKIKGENLSREIALLLKSSSKS